MLHNMYKESHDGEVRALRWVLVEPRGHVNHQSAFTSDFDVPQDVREGCCRRARPATQRQKRLPSLFAFVRRLHQQALDW